MNLYLKEKESTSSGEEYNRNPDPVSAMPAALASQIAIDAAGDVASSTELIIKFLEKLDSSFLLG